MSQSFQGYLLAAHPLRQGMAEMAKSVLFVVDHDSHGAIALQINRPYNNELSFETVMHNVGLSLPENRPLYNGGTEGQNRVNIIHSLDWYTGNTVKLTEDLGVSHDVSILAAISECQGPDYFRVVAGFTKWHSSELEKELLPLKPQVQLSQTWLAVPADLESVFDYDEDQQWRHVINEATKIETKHWFNHARY